MTRRIFFDTEWTAVPWSGCAELMWIGLADEHGGSCSAISADVDIDPATNDFVAGVWTYISPADRRIPSREILTGVIDFCGDIDEFWAWVPTLESVTEFCDLGHDAPAICEQYWDWDLQLFRSLVDPWPDGWPELLCDLNAAAVESGVEIPPRRPDHLAPTVHAVWNADLFTLIATAHQD